MENNRQIVIEFIEEGLLHNNIDFVKKYVSETYIQHDAMVEDGRSGLIKLMQVTKIIPFKRTTIIKTIMDQDCIAIIRAIGILHTFETSGTVREALGLASKTYTISLQIAY